MTVINDEEAQWDSSKRKEDDKGRHLPSFFNNDRKCVKASKKKPICDLSTCDEEFQKELNISKEEYQKWVRNSLCLYCGRKGHYFGDCKVHTPSSSGKGKQS